MFSRANRKNIEPFNIRIGKVFYIFIIIEFTTLSIYQFSFLWTYYIRLDTKLRELLLHNLTLNYEKTKQKLHSII